MVKSCKPTLTVEDLMHRASAIWTKYLILYQTALTCFPVNIYSCKFTAYSCVHMSATLNLQRINLIDCFICLMIQERIKSNP